jgi:hypothetical protein
MSNSGLRSSTSFVITPSKSQFSLKDNYYSNIVMFPGGHKERSSILADQ